MTPRRETIVVGASSGGLSALTALLKHLPRELPAAIVAVIHQLGHGRNMLVDVLRRVSPLPVEEARDGAALQLGHLYVPPIDRHLLVTDGHLVLSHGPKENFVRPAVDPLFRSAARSFGARAIGVVLSGSLDDGTAGLLAIKRRGGLVMVQDPETAAQPGMPESALEVLEADLVGSPEQIGQRLAEVAGTPIPATGTRSGGPDGEVEVQEEGDTDMDLVKSLGVPSTFSCPSCNGVLWEIREGRLVRYRCHSGHAFGIRTLDDGKEEGLEMSLWTAIRALQEKAELSRRLAERARGRGAAADVRRSEERLAFMERQVASLRDLIDKL
jgi:two-component system chemotaxis response regulator CheB